MSDPVDADALLAEQVAYYRARAPEYDEVYERRGRYEHKQEEVNRQWLDESEKVKYALDAFRPSGHVLELAPGTGEWTLQIARHAETITAVDASSEALAIAREKLAETSTPVRFVEADLFKWKPERRFDAVVFAFWLSHSADAIRGLLSPRIRGSSTWRALLLRRQCPGPVVDR